MDLERSNKFNHNWLSLQFYDDAFITKGNHSMKVGGAFERMHYDVLEQLSPNGRFNNYNTLAKFLSNAPNQLNALAPGGSTQVAFRESLFAFYFQDDWHAYKRLTFNLGLRYEATTRPKDAIVSPAIPSTDLPSHGWVSGGHNALELLGQQYCVRSGRHRQHQRFKSNDQRFLTPSRISMGYFW